MAEQPVRVVLLARAGQVRERLEQALREVGAEVVAVADPVTGDAAGVVATAPQAVLVALDPAIEQALEDYAGLLFDPDVMVIYEEAGLVAARDGWDAARWVRHLASKLYRHDDVLPPGTEPEDQQWQLAPEVLPPQRREVGEAELESLQAEVDANAAKVPRASGPEDDMDAGRLTLVEEASGEDGVAPDASGPVLAAVDAPVEAAGEAVPDVLADLEQRIAGLSLVDEDDDRSSDSVQAAPDGAVLVEAGLGGPDPVRQLLSGLPEGFPCPVLVRLHLDGGRYDRLVRQMQRATRLGVTLAEAGAAAEPGQVCFLPPGLSLEYRDQRLYFVHDEAAAQHLPEALLSVDSVVLLLSGSDSALADEAMNEAWAGALVLGQSLEDSYAPAASARLLELGGQVAAPAQIVERLLERWPSGKGPAATFEELPEP